MSTEAQMQANRLNAQKSTGPRTPDGKSVASQNAVKHGLLAENDVISSENQSEFDTYRQQLINELNPFGLMESIIAERIVSLTWRLKRAVRFQKQAIDSLKFEQDHSSVRRHHDDLRPPKKYLSADFPSYEELAFGYLTVQDFSDQRVLEHLLIYERRIENSLYKTIREFQRLKLAGKPKTESETPADQPISFNPYTNAANINESISQNEPNSNQITSNERPATSDELCKTNPISNPLKNTGNIITCEKTMSYNNEQQTTNYELLKKQTQSVPSDLSAEAPVLRSLGEEGSEKAEVEGPKPILPASIGAGALVSDHLFDKSKPCKYHWLIERSK